MAYIVMHHSAEIAVGPFSDRSAAIAYCTEYHGSEWETDGFVSIIQLVPVP